jgi:hypothetical protein
MALGGAAAVVGVGALGGAALGWVFGVVVSGERPFVQDGKLAATQIITAGVGLGVGSVGGVLYVLVQHFGSVAALGALGGAAVVYGGYRVLLRLSNR